MQELFELYDERGWDKPFVVQIGAMDGIEFDDARHLLDRYEYPGLFVEPIPKMFDRLISNFGDREHYKFEQAAITEEDGNVRMLTVDADLIERENLPAGYKGMSALYPLRNGFGSDYERDIEVKGKFGQNIVVPGMTFKTLAKKHSLPTENLIVLCDVEGHDYKVFKQVMEITQPIWMRYEWMLLKPEEQAEMKETALQNGYIIMEEGQDILFVRKDVYEKLEKHPEEQEENKPPKNSITIVTGLWNINRTGRDFNHYIEAFKKFLDIPQNLFIYIPKEYEHLVWEKRQRKNTHVKVYELNDLKKIYQPFWDRTQKIRTSEKWKNQAGWLPSSPQAQNEWYNPIVQSKMFLLNDVTIWNPFDTEYFYWLDAGITNTVPYGHLAHDNVLEKITEHSNPFLFLSYPYEANKEIHGFDFEAINKYAGKEVKYVCRGGLFGGHKTQVNEANGLYYLFLDRTLSDGYMGTEESIFSIMAHLYPDIYRRYELDENGFIVKFTEALLKDTVNLVEVDKPRGKVRTKPNYSSLKDVKTNVYILTFNFPEQVRYIVDSMKKVPEWVEQPHIVLLDNSTLEEAKTQNSSLAKELGFEYIWLEGNTGICGGRQSAADHFNDSEADYMLFFEDDMTINSVEEEGNFCRKGFRKYIPKLYEIIHKIMLKENFDFLKLSFSEVYWDNNIQTSWYNVPQNIRSLVWPDYDKLPVNGIDPNAPRTKFNTIDEVDGVSYITGEIVYSNWPMIVSKEGNRKMFIDTKWDHPYEQTWMSHLFQETLKGRLKGAVLLASPIFHNRIAHYQREDRREN